MIYKMKKRLLNIKSGLLLFSLVPTFILFIFISIVFSNSQYQKALSQAENKLSKATQEINTTLDQAMQFSIKAISNPSLISIFEQNYDGMDSNYQSARSLEMFFSNYFDTFSSSRNNIIFYHNNYTMYRSGFSKYLESLDPTLLEQLLKFDLSDMLWLEDEDSFLFYKATNSSTFTLISEYTVPKYTINTIIDKFDVLVNENSPVVNEFTLSASPLEESDNVYSHKLLNDQYINLLIPNALKTRIYLSNILIFAMIYIALALLMFLFANLFATRFKHKMSKFIDTIAENNDLTDIRNMSHDRDDVLTPVYDKLLELITNINDLHLQYNEITAEKNLIELKYIQSKFNPHLLYNTLSVLKWNCINDENMTRCIDTMVDYYRACTNANDVVSLADEIDLVKKYINLVEFAYAREYKIIFDIDDKLLGFKTMKHILQPFVENAILHGIAENPDGYVKVEAYTENDFVILKVIDNGNCITPERLAELKKPDYFSEYKSFGIKNTRERLKFIHGENSDITVESVMNEFTCITIKISIDSQL